MGHQKDTTEYYTTKLTRKENTLNLSRENQNCVDCCRQLRMCVNKVIDATENLQA